MSVTLAAGKLNRRVQVQTYTTARLPSGQEQKSWTTAATVWVQMRVLSGREFFLAQRPVDETVGEFTMRYREELVVDTPMRLIDAHGGIWEVESVKDVEFMHEALVVMAVKRG